MVCIIYYMVPKHNCALAGTSEIKDERQQCWRRAFPLLKATCTARNVFTRCILHLIIRWNCLSFLFLVSLSSKVSSNQIIARTRDLRFHLIVTFFPASGSRFGFLFSYSGKIKERNRNSFLHFLFYEYIQTSSFTCASHLVMHFSPLSHLECCCCFQEWKCSSLEKLYAVKWIARIHVFVC